MALSAGLVQQMTWADSYVLLTVGPSPTSLEILFVRFDPADSDRTLGFKRSLVRLLAQAALASYPVEIQHADSSAEVDWARYAPFDISPIGAAVHDDAYAVTGSAIPADARVVFDSPTATVTITPDVVRPHWVFVESLPSAVPAGRNTVRLQSAGGWASDAVPVEVRAGPAQAVRTLYPGEPKTRPYTIVFVANPGIQDTAGAFVADPILGNRPGYLDALRFCLQNLFTLTEDVLRQGDWDGRMRLVSIFDATLAATDSNSLAHELPPNLMETRRVRLRPFVARFGEIADMVMVVHGSATHDRATAWYTTDDGTLGGTGYTYDGVARTHGHFPSVPGSAALPVGMNQTGLTPLHEFGHGASDFDNGRVYDLYVDGLSGFDVNKKARALSTDPIPANFATYNGTVYASDPNRDGLGYPAAWTSYQADPIDPANPNLMDNYWLAPGGNPRVCRLDRLTYDWFTDRLRAKLDR